MMFIYFNSEVVVDYYFEPLNEKLFKYLYIIKIITFVHFLGFESKKSLLVTF